MINITLWDQKGRDVRGIAVAVAKLPYFFVERVNIKLFIFIITLLTQIIIMPALLSILQKHFLRFIPPFFLSERSHQPRRLVSP